MRTPGGLAAVEQSNLGALASESSGAVAKTRRDGPERRAKSEGAATSVQHEAMEAPGVNLRTIEHQRLIYGEVGEIDPDFPDCVCEDCRGSGIDPGGLSATEPEVCAHCKGSGI